MSDDLLDVLAGAPAPAAPPMSAALEAELAALTPTAPRRPLRQLAILAAASVVYYGVLLAIVTVRADFGELPIAWIVGAGTAWLVAFMIPLYLAVVPRRGAMKPQTGRAGARTAIKSGAVKARGRAIQPSGARSLDYGWEHVLRGHWCMWLGLATAVVPVVLGAIFLRGALPVGSRWIAATLGAAGGGLGGLLLHAHCRIADGVHIGLVHGSVVVVAALLSAFLVPRATDRPFASVDDKRPTSA